MPTVEDLDAVKGPLGAVLLELPLRDGGYLLPTWEELVDLSRACRERGVPLHLDGARLWESAPYWGRELHEVAALADSVYVSFYKGLRGLAGAVVAGPADVVDEARQWRTRMGGTLFSLHPYAVGGAARAAARAAPDGRVPRARGRAGKAVAGQGIRVFPSRRTPTRSASTCPAPLPRSTSGSSALMEPERLALTPPFTTPTCRAGPGPS